MGGNRPPVIEQVKLDGRRKTLYTLQGGEPVDLEGLHSWAFVSLKWSPDGQYLAHHLRMNSASLTADVVETGVLDIANQKIMSLNKGLQYPAWLAFSPDSGGLVYIAGIGRDVITNKRLEVASSSAGWQVIDCSRDGFVDSQPVWLPDEPRTLLFCRGPEVNLAPGLDTLPAVMVPGQRIYRMNRDGQVMALTAGPAATADYYPDPSPSGEEMVFLRLERFDQGSLYLQPLKASEKAVEILRGLRGGPGFYGNYYPAWVSIYWF